MLANIRKHSSPVSQKTNNNNSPPFCYGLPINRDLLVEYIQATGIVLRTTAENSNSLIPDGLSTVIVFE